jgi:hypothetical protein
VTGRVPFVFAPATAGRVPFVFVPVRAVPVVPIGAVLLVVLVPDAARVVPLWVARLLCFGFAISYLVFLVARSRADRRRMR